MVSEVLALLQPAARQTIVDCTLGGGGHARAILALMAAPGRLIGIDQDDDALAAAAIALKDFHNLCLLKGNFGSLKTLLADWSSPIDGFLFDLGVSSWQLDNPARGFAFKQDAPLDMRMNQEGLLSAYEIVNTWSARELTKIFWTFGEERWSSRVAEFIVNARKAGPIATTGELVSVIKAAIPAGARRGGGHPGRRIFQALRIAVNSELENLRLGLEAAVDLCSPGGVIVAISYHSLEDRIVKQFFKEKAGGSSALVETDRPALSILTKKPLRPEATERDVNPRSRSAKLRAAVKLSSND